MVRYNGKLSLTEEGVSIHTRIASGSKLEYDIPLKELFEELLGQEVSIEIHRMVPFDPEKIEQGDDPNE